MLAKCVLLIVPPGSSGTVPNHEGSAGMGAVETAPGGFRYPPHTVAEAAACLRAAGRPVEALDAPAAGLTVSETVAQARNSHASVVAVQVSWATRQADGECLAALRAADRQWKLVAFGVSLPYVAPELLASADVCLAGEPALALVTVCQRLLDGDTLPREVAAADLPGHDAAGRIVDLDALPVPAWDLLPHRSYPFLTVFSSRGCDQGCGWCPYVVAQGATLRQRSAQSVIDELCQVIACFQPARLVFRDPAFSKDRERVVALCQGLLSHSLLRPGRNLKWECEAYPEHLDGRLVRLMALAGCIGIKVGLETTDPELLTREGRVAEASQVAGYLARTAALARECASVGIAYRLFVLVGLPGQTLAAVRETAGFVTALQPHELTIKRLTCYPGTHLTGGEWPTEELVQQQTAILEAARAQIGAGRQGSSARWRWALARRVYRWQARLRARRRLCERW
jgi:radical SAM superfamily enzyme YgiQ (UPF0313 family)